MSRCVELSGLPLRMLVDVTRKEFARFHRISLDKRDQSQNRIEYFHDLTTMRQIIRTFR